MSNNHNPLKALSRREEDEIQKRAKLNSLKACDELVSAFATCSSTRTFSVIWACRTQWKELQDCIKSQITQDKLDIERLEFIKHREDLKVPYKKL
ncbi:hypothetical protein CROQUDRAFT_669960 [Cronartium quercuum f. sp. fusiforme G11]|uniref:COX assembly mitochondrial protein n=1 Tax=Cronartium quercuum f. sp. fusiforme G11 TaxID=708437 RepID=A0A9P6NRM0_9BASI|nr:hypothetical protein CROQUDRAFT_669960 [Cronartium quercuum f. sp. fusiforme G11]